MQQTPLHDAHNPDLLQLMPPSAANVIEIGCSSGALAREFKKLNPRCTYLGVDIDADYLRLAKRHCDAVETLNLDDARIDFYQRNRHRDAWIFGDTLEHLKDPWKVLECIGSVLPSGGSVVACIPNAQHWSVQVRLATGDFRYEDSGLLDRTHLRWFTRKTIFELFDSTGFQVVEARSRVFDEPQRDRFIALIGSTAEAAGHDPQLAMNDALPLQYVIRATPKS